MTVTIALGIIGVVWLAGLLLALGLCRSAAATTARQPERRTHLRTFHS
jgi:hypothetical protein